MKHEFTKLNHVFGTGRTYKIRDRNTFRIWLDDTNVLNAIYFI